ncbi:MAG: NDMA-dependent alcohol dehydrogenase [Ilumatobacter sp.]|jgi:NDMA-dependent alcohol dehydrogenase|uniref:NDMA-dependent alcohol dehydrogenase n=1 Tax=Ilumatobacter sp. TaxID=1967498 RepID=UPI001E0B713B|nr:NDMA-dependent alcohol dehydrogenase [Ilumatobacter sp.]MBT5275623.1 NDMA-dependent alcohol dehydrogenase [Ilumatobacter sp.]MBT5553377.1 NDMA-dependent alcohol dehydrogenase [Ilumatobacter sp.]MBT5865976.1 NDMA-dependent alcohol dehydrogenase [Ilumatobacter sp.]MBT7429889.1 NDMA-dependent alcohol dehydrogenase [Ilumatobacter sp.]
MLSRAALLYDQGQAWVVEQIEVDPPKANEVLVQWKAAGLCHSDEHIVTGDMVPPREAWDAMGITDLFPMIGGHEGAGVIVEVGPGVRSVEVGDHVSASFVPSCGRCRYCSTGRQNLCDSSGGTFLKGMITDGTSRHRLVSGPKAGTELNLFAKLGTFSEYTCVAADSVIKVEKDLPLEAVALVSCGVATGWGSATNRANVEPGDTVVVVGIGGIGMNAVQGAAMAGARHVIAVDPIEFKREKAMEFGATHTFSSMEEAFPQVNELSWGMMADKVIMTPGVLYGEMMELGTKLAGKGGTIVVTGIAPMDHGTSSVNLFELAMWNKEIKGTIFGSLNPRADIPKLLGMYREGQLKLDELITKTYALDEINEGYRAMRDGENIRGVVTYV